MAKKGKPRSGSMGVWPRKKAARKIARVRSYPEVKEPKLMGFAGYKAGMTHLMVVEQNKNKPNAGQETFTPATIIECPPLKIFAIRLYKDQNVSKQLNFKSDKELSRALHVPKKFSTKEDLDKVDLEKYDDLRVLVYTQPKLTSIKKTPELFELPIGGNIQDKLNFVKENLQKEINITDVFEEGQLIDTHAVTKGKGFQGPIRRFGISMTASKSEKARRNPGSLGGWKSQGHVMYRVPHAGQTGYHLRTQNNNLILKIGKDPKEVNPKGGFLRFGNVKSTYVIVKGSIQGPKKRLITLTPALRPKKKIPHSSDSITHISTESKQ